MSLEHLVTLLRDFGFPVVVAIILLYWAWRKSKKAEEREVRMGARIDQLEDDHRKELVTLTSQYATLTGKVGEALCRLDDTIKRLNRNFDNLVDNIEDMPCLALPDEPGTVGRKHNLLDRLPRAMDRTGETTGAEISKETAARLARRG